MELTAPRPVEWGRQALVRSSHKHKTAVNRYKERVCTRGQSGEVSPGLGSGCRSRMDIDQVEGKSRCTGIAAGGRRPLDIQSSRSGEVGDDTRGAGASWVTASFVFGNNEQPLERQVHTCTLPFLGRELQRNQSSCMWTRLEAAAVVKVRGGSLFLRLLQLNLGRR